MPQYVQHLCGLYYNVPHFGSLNKVYLSQADIKVHATILATTSRTTLQQTFQNPSTTSGIKQVRYAFPLYDGVSVVAFQCHVAGRLIAGEVKEKEQAKQTYNDAVQRGESAGLLEQLPEASDVFTTTIGNIPPGAKVNINITYLGELKHDLDVDGIRFTVPANICPRYGNVYSPPLQWYGSISITVDAEMPEGSFIQRLQSPSHPISMSMGTTSVDPDATPSMSKASATLSLGVTQLHTDFILQIIAKDTGVPKAILETHPTIPNQRALMATLVPKFALPPEKPEIVFVCDQSGSMGGSIELAKEALQLFLKSLPLGVKFNICSFGSNHSFLFPRSASYSQETLATATRHAAGLSASYGGTEMLQPLRATIEQRYQDLPLDIILLTDGEIWEQQQLFDYLNAQVQSTSAPIRVFTLGIGNDVSHSLIEGVARAGNGFAQAVQHGEKLNSKVVRMLKGALSPHINDYTLEVEYSDSDAVERVADSLNVMLDLKNDRPVTENPPKKISLFDTTSKPDASPVDKDQYAHLPSIPAPKALQVPQHIPSLFAFNRSTIYLLLGPSAPSSTPTSVILRGTSAHGPLELEIPVHVLQEKGETIHQLAAKKAVSELEQGRGWLASARTPGGELLKTKFDGRFSDMVEREAVRLGVQFQVGGKWCTFVATERKIVNTSDGDGQNEGNPMDGGWEYLDEQAVVSEAGNKENIPSSSLLGRPSSSYPSTGGLFGSSNAQPAPSGGLFSPPTGVSKPAFGAACSNPSSFSPFGTSSLSNSAGGSLFGSSSTAQAAPSHGLFGAPTGVTKPAFGIASLFGAPSSSVTPVSGPFGPSSDSPQASGATLLASSSTSLFGAPFSGNPTTGSLFGSSSAAPRASNATPLISSSTSLFGAPSSSNPTTGGLFGSSSTSPPTDSHAKALQDYQMGLMVLHQDNPRRLRMAKAAAEPRAAPAVAHAPPSIFGPSSQAPSHENSSFDAGDSALENFDYDSFLQTTQGPKPSVFSHTTGFSNFTDGNNKTLPVNQPPLSPQTVLQSLIAHQSFTGEFSSSAQLLDWLCVSTADFQRVLSATCAATGLDEGNGTNLLATALVVVYMERKLAALRDEWELVYDKARTWLEECGDGEKWLAAARELVQASV